MAPVCTQRCRNLEPEEMGLGACSGSLPPVRLAQEKAEGFLLDHLAVLNVLISNSGGGSVSLGQQLGDRC